jgi:hypothetical protein
VIGDQSALWPGGRVHIPNYLVNFVENCTDPFNYLVNFVANYLDPDADPDPACYRMKGSRR